MALSKSISRSLLQLGATVLFISAVEGFTLLTSANPQALAPSISRAPSAIVHLQGESTAATPTSTNVPTLLYLNVTTAAPDPLGIANISGAYGPGAWVVWFITGFAAWRRILVRSEERIDLNSWAFLFGINWAAVDILRTLHALRSISPKNDSEFSSHMGLYGAAFTVVFWGTTNALLQACVIPDIFQYSRILSQRMAIHVVGLILPNVSLLASLYLFQSLQNGDIGFDLLPALYFRGMSNIHAFYLLVACLTPIIFFPPAFMCYVACKLDLHPPMMSAFNPCYVLEEVPRHKMLYYGFKVFIAVSFMSFIIFIILGMGMSSPIAIIFMIPFLFFFFMAFPVFVPTVWIFFLCSRTAYYIWNGYFYMNPDTWISESCYFMPCSPQSIKDNDQIYALLAGIFVFVGFEVFPPALRHLRQVYRENWIFVLMVEGAIKQLEMRRRVSAASSIDLEDM